jgi:hypothetical protein
LGRAAGRSITYGETQRLVSGAAAGLRVLLNPLLSGRDLALPARDSPGILRHWAAEHRWGNATTEDFIALAERDSGLDLDRCFDVWLFQPAKPTSW